MDGSGLGVRQRLARLDRRRAVETLGLVVLVAAVLPFVVFAVPQLVGADHGYVVMSSSMAPAIQPGDVVIVASVPPARVEAGEVITFDPPAEHPDASADRVTHRVVDVVDRPDGRYYRTKGDANEEPDGTLVPARNVIGENILTIPLIGYVIVFAGTPMGLATLVVAPSVLLVASELHRLVAAWRAQDEPAGRSPLAPEREEDGR